MVLVPVSRQGQRVVRELSEGALVVIQGPGMTSVLAGALAVTAVLAIPGYGVWCSAVVLMMGASAYGEIIRRVSLGASDQPRRGWRASLVPGSIPKAVACALMAAGTVLPLWFLNSGLHQSPHWDGVGRAVASTTWVVLPVLMVMLYGRAAQDTRPGPRARLGLLARHPFALLLALAVVPTTLALMELAIVLFLYVPGNLPFFALDYMPMPSSPWKPEIHRGIPFYQLLDYRSYSDSMFIQGYFDGLRHGYSFEGAIPASLSLPTRAELNSEAIELSSAVYLAARVLITMFVVIGLLTAFAIQARWLGAIAARENKRPA